ncbi:MAG: hypothetical protein RL088_1053 [Verrucomicrobiota bacterium]
MSESSANSWGLSSVTASLKARRAAIAAKAPAPTGILNPDELERFENLLVFAKSAVEGYLAGRHKSPFTGSSAEFADYKEYAPGDPLTRLDWRVYGRTRKLFVRQYEDETDMTVYLLVDASASMRYAGTKKQSKFLLASRIAAALAYLMHKQADKSALILFADKVKTFLAAGATRRHLHKMVQELEKTTPSDRTGIAGALTEAVPLCKKRGRLVLISDFLDDRTALFDALSQFVHKRFDILLLQVLDADELNLPARSVAKFVDAETRETVEVDADEIRAAYQRRMRDEINALAREADLLQIQHRLCDTANPYIDAIEAYMGFRGKQP